MATRRAPASPATEDKPGWAVEKRLRIEFIAFMVIQLVGGSWFLAELNATQRFQQTQIVSLQDSVRSILNNLTMNESRAADRFSKVEGSQLVGIEILRRLEEEVRRYGQLVSPPRPGRQQ